jgi:hypothetical protein
MVYYFVDVEFNSQLRDIFLAQSANEKRNDACLQNEDEIEGKMR